MIFLMLSLVTPLWVTRQANTVTSRQRERRNKVLYIGNIVQRIADVVAPLKTLFGRADGTGTAKRTRSAKKNLGAIIIKILNKKELNKNRFQ